VCFLKISNGCVFVRALLGSEFECVDSRPELAPPTVQQLTEVVLFSSYSDGTYLSVITFVPRQM
jgi:hypothetical protein